MLRFKVSTVVEDFQCSLSLSLSHTETSLQVCMKFCLSVVLLLVFEDI